LGIGSGLVAVATALTLAALPDLGLAPLVLRHLPPALRLPLVVPPVGAALAVLLPLALDRLLGRLSETGHAAILLASGLVGGLACGAVEPALLMAAALVLARPAEAAVAVLSHRRHGAARAEPELHEVAADGTDGLLTIDSHGTVLSADAKALELMGGDPIGRSVFRYLPRLAADGPGLDRLPGRRLETELQHESSRFRPVELEVIRYGGPADKHLRFRLTDISERAERMAELERLALHDALTGLPNRALFNDRVRQAIAAAERHPEPFAVLLLDLDRFKQVNDTLGHQVGDRLLQAVGPRLAAVLRKSDTLARFGGDEFAVLLPPPVDLESTAAMAERLIDSMQPPYLIDGMSLDIGVSIGVALHPEHGADLDSLVHNADVAMYEAKAEQIGYSIFNAEQGQGSARRLALQRELRPAIDRGDLQVLFQPKVAIQGWQATGAEALVRWNHPIEGTLQPEAFLPIAEHTGLIMPLTLKVVNDCLEAQRLWRGSGVDLSVSINVSPKWLRDREFPKILRLLLHNWQGRPEQLTLEIPENAVMLDTTGTLEALDAVAALGVGVTLDHFGTGYSSLPMLQRLPITALKIDRTFIGNLFESRSASVVVRSVVKLAHGLGLRVIASGVESERAADHLAAIGCDEIQGFHVGRPMAAEQMPHWLQRQAARRQTCS
jgi:diguanylate cyclase (GGDEF)-like protein